MSLATGIRRRFAFSTVRRGGWPLPTTLLERLRDFSNYALGAGCASLSNEENGEAAFLRRLAAFWADRDEVMIVDVGAHIGYYAEAALAAFGGRARVDCFEPDPANYQGLTERLGTRVGCYQLALSDATGVAPLFTYPDDNGVFSSLYRDAYAGIHETHSTEVELDTLDRVADRLGIDRIELLKVDVEGHELAVLQGAAGLLAEDRIEVIQFEFGENNIASRTYLRDFSDLLPNHRLFRLSPRGLKALDYRPSNEVFLLSENYVAAHRISGLT